MIDASMGVRTFALLHLVHRPFTLEAEAISMALFTFETTTES